MPCEHCPVREGRCRAEVDPRYAVFCTMASAGEASQLAAIRASSAGRPDVPVLDPDRRPEPVPPATDLAADLVLLQRARACRHKVAPECGCRYGDCTRLGREVSPRDCLDCLRGGDDGGS